MAAWEYFDTIRLYDLDVEPVLRSQYTWASLLVFVVLTISFLQPKSGNEIIDAPIIGSELSWIARWRFFSDANKVINEGHTKVEQPMTHHLAQVNFLSVQGWHLQAQRA